MSDKKVSELDSIAGSATAADDLFLIVDSSGSVTKKITRAELNNAIEQDVLSTVDINGGTIDSTVIGGTTPAAGDFTTLAVDNININGNTISSTDTNGNITVDPNGAGQINLSANVDVTGTVTADAATIDNGVLTVNDAGTRKVEISGNGFGDFTSSPVLDGGIEFTNQFGHVFSAGVSNSNNFDILDGATKIARFAGGGDISFFADDGTTQALFFDASTQRLGLGSTSPSAVLHGNSASNSVYFYAQTTSASREAGIQLGNTASTGTYIYKSANTDDLNFYLNASNRMTITSAGSVGIGTSSPDAPMAIQRPSNNQGVSAGISLKGQDGTTQGGLGTDGVNDNAVQLVANQFIKFHTNNTDGTTNERMRLDSSGNLLVGKTAAGYQNDGMEFNDSSNKLFLSNVNAFCANLNRGGSDGSFIEFTKSGTTVGSIGANSSRTYIGSGSGQSGIKFNTNAIVPVAGADGANSDNTYDLGVSSARFKDAYFSGTVNADALSIDSYSDPTNNYITLRPSFAPSASGGVGFAAKDHDGANNDGLGIYGHDGISFTTGGSERMRILAGGGLTFNGDTATANALDDYEEGTYTPAFTSSGASFSYSVQLGSYVKIGELVCCWFNITLNASPSGTTSNQVTFNVPFATKAVDVSLYSGGHIGHYFNIDLGSGTTVAYQLPSTSATQIELKEVGDNIGENGIVASELNSNAVIRGSVMYRAAS